MKTPKDLRRAWLAALVLLLPGKESRGADGDPSDRLFRELVPRMEIRIDATAERSLRNDPRTYVGVTVLEGGVTYTNVSLKLKGARGSFRYYDDRPALTLNFGREAEGQRFHGLRKLHLNNSVQDWTMMNEMLASEVFLAAGVPTARATHAMVQLNNRKLGLYVLKEGYDKTFLKRHFKEATGNLYDGGFIMDVDEPLELDEGDPATQRADLKALTAAAYERDLARRLERFEAVLDVDRFLTFAALEMMLCDWDGYVEKRNNYRLYFDPGDGRAVFIPHGKDQLFEWPGYPVMPSGGGLVARQLLEIPAVRERYVNRLGEVLEETFTAERLTNTVDRIVGRLRNQLGDDQPRLVDQVALPAGSVKQRLVERVRLVREEYDYLPRPLVFDAAGRATLSRWEPSTESGSAKHERGADPDRLVIRASDDGRTVASWRTRVYLTAGHYRFAALATTQGVEAWTNALGSGAGLRVSGARQSETGRVAGSVKDHPLQHEFQITSGRSVEFVAELRAVAGEVAFDAQSLRLERIP